MAAYIVGKLAVTHWNWYRAYRQTTEPLVEKHGGRYLIKGGASEHLEGSTEAPDAFVLIEFPDKQSALNWYRDPGYADMIKLRGDSGVETELFIVEGFDAPEKFRASS